MIFFCFTLPITALIIWVFWRILEKAGFSGPLAFLALIPLIGPVILLCILAFAEWTPRRVPMPGQAPGYWQQGPYQQQTFYPPYQQPYNPMQPMPPPYYPQYPPQQMPPPTSYP